MYYVRIILREEASFNQTEINFSCQEYHKFHSKENGAELQFFGESEDDIIHEYSVEEMNGFKSCYIMNEDGKTIDKFVYS